MRFIHFVLFFVLYGLADAACPRVIRTTPALYETVTCQDWLTVKLQFDQEMAIRGSDTIFGVSRKIKFEEYAAFRYILS